MIELTPQEALKHGCESENSNLHCALCMFVYTHGDKPHSAGPCVCPCKICETTRHRAWEPWHAQKLEDKITRANEIRKAWAVAAGVPEPEPPPEPPAEMLEAIEEMKPE